MTRQGRTLLMLGLISLAAAVALGAMARRYSALLTVQSDAPRTQAEQEAADEVAAFLAVRRELEHSLARAATAGGVPTLEEQRRTFEGALARTGLDRERFRKLERLCRAWRADAEAVPPVYRAALGRHAEEVRRLEPGPYDPLEL